MASMYDKIKQNPFIIRIKVSCTCFNNPLYTLFVKSTSDDNTSKLLKNVLTSYDILKKMLDIHGCHFFSQSDINDLNFQF